MGKLDKIGLFGGTFDPIHKAHIQIALTAIEQFDLDRVDFITAKISPGKENTTFFTCKQRLEFVEKSITQLQNQGLFSNDLEFHRHGTSYSYLTIEDYKKIYPEAQLYWIMGADSFFYLDSWANYEKLIEDLNFIVFNRDNKLAIENDKPEQSKKFLQNPKLKVEYVKSFDLYQSSTRLKEILKTRSYSEVANTNELDDLLPDSIKDLVINHYYLKSVE